MISAGLVCGNASSALQPLLCDYVRPSLRIPRATAEDMLQATRLDASDVEALFAKHATASRSSDAADEAVAALGRRLALPCRPAPLRLNNAGVRPISEHILSHPRVGNDAGSMPRGDVAATSWAAA